MKIKIYSVIKHLLENNVNGEYDEVNILYSTTDKERAISAANKRYEKKVKSLNEETYSDDKLFNVFCHDYNVKGVSGGGYVKLVRNGLLYKKIEFFVDESELEIS